MGFRFRKSINAGPFRINLSKSGIGYSVGGKGFRITKKANGGLRTTTSIPGTGISYTKDFSGSKKSTASQGRAVNQNMEPPIPPEQPRDKKPWYRRWWAYVIAAVIVIGIIGAIGENQESAVTEAPAGNDAISENADIQAATDTADEPPAAEQGSDTPETEPEDEAAGAKTETPETEQPEDQPAAGETTDGAAPVTPPADPVVEQPVQQPAEEPAQPVTEPVTEPEPVEAMVWVTKTGKRYHSIPDCGSTKSATQIPLSQAESRGLNSMS